jgi:hypothetical protein
MYCLKPPMDTPPEGIKLVSYDEFCQRLLSGGSIIMFSGSWICKLCEEDERMVIGHP